MGRVKLKELDGTEYLSPGNLACAACPEMLGFRHILSELGPETIVINGTGCLAVVTQMGVPRVPHFHVLFENAAAVISGIDDSLEVMGRREGVNLLVVAGDGGTADIGLASLSGAIERNQDFIYVCFDNESYMNTGGQRSGTTPFGARTSNTPIGREIRGEDRRPGLRKDMVEIVAAHNIPYAASTSVAYPLDIIERVRKAAAVRGPSFINIHSPCPTGWGVETKDVVEAARRAVKCGAVVMYEVEDGVRRITKKTGKRVPVRDYLSMQGRFKHLIGDEEAVAGIQASVDRNFDAIHARIA
jgi:pyruvate ferredoxin oxidoreductase beta subunit